MILKTITYYESNRKAMRYDETSHCMPVILFATYFAIFLLVYDDL